MISIADYQRERQAKISRTAMAGGVVAATAPVVAVVVAVVPVAAFSFSGFVREATVFFTDFSCNLTTIVQVSIQR
jgi:hypothetical protein